jgi:hypothetical protein
MAYDSLGLQKPQKQQWVPAPGIPVYASQMMPLQQHQDHYLQYQQQQLSQQQQQQQYQHPYQYYLQHQTQGQIHGQQAPVQASAKAPIQVQAQAQTKVGGSNYASEVIRTFPESNNNGMGMVSAPIAAPPRSSGEKGQERYANQILANRLRFSTNGTQIVYRAPADWNAYIQTRSLTDVPLTNDEKEKVGSAVFSLTGTGTAIDGLLRVRDEPMVNLERLKGSIKDYDSVVTVFTALNMMAVCLKVDTPPDEDTMAMVDAKVLSIFFEKIQLKHKKIQFMPVEKFRNRLSEPLFDALSGKQMIMSWKYLRPASWKLDGKESNDVKKLITERLKYRTFLINLWLTMEWFVEKVKPPTKRLGFPTRASDYLPKNLATTKFDNLCIAVVEASVMAMAARLIGCDRFFNTDKFAKELAQIDLVVNKSLIDPMAKTDNNQTFIENILARFSALS